MNEFDGVDESFNPRKIIRVFLERVNPYKNSSSDVPDVMQFSLSVDRFKRSVIYEILGEELKAEHPYEGLLAAYLILELFGTGDFVRPAIELFLSSLSSSDAEMARMALAAAKGWTKIPPELITSLIALVTNTSSNLQFQAAMILALSFEHRFLCIPVLVAALDGDDLAARLESALVCIKGGIHPERAWDALVTFPMACSKVEFYEAIAVMLNTVAPNDVGVKFLRHLVLDEELKIETRSQFVRLLGLAATDPKTVQRFLVKLIRSPDWQMVYAAADAIAHLSDEMPGAAVDALVDQLSNSELSVREAAAISIHRCCSALRMKHASQVAKRLVVERDFEVFASLLQLCVIAEAEALPAVSAAINEVSHLRQLLLCLALVEMGSQAHAELFRMLARATDQSSKILFSGLISSLRIADPEVMDQLKDMIFGHDPEDSELALKAIANAGEAAAFLTVDLLRLVVGDDLKKSALASRAIEGIGPRALPFFALVDIGKHGDRVDVLRIKLESSGHGVGEHELSWFEDIASLRVFVLMAGIVNQMNGASYAQAASVLENLEGKGQIDKSLGVSKSNLSRVKELVETAASKRWGHTVEFMEYRNKKWYLTRDGRTFYRRAERYIALLGLDKTGS